jgi:membrane fusion protein, multidrug efflux system
MRHRVGLALALLAGCLFVSACDRKPPQAAGRAGPPPQVSVVTVQPRTVPIEFSENGQVAASRRVEIRARIRGFILERHFQEGGPVKEGQILYTIDPREYEVMLAQTNAQLVRARANLDLASRDVERLAPLVRQQSVSKKELDDAEARRQAATGEVAAANAEIDRAKLNLSFCKVYSPVTGLVGIAQKRVGALVDDGANSLLTECLQVDPMHINFNIPERAMLRYRRDVETGRINIPGRQEDWKIAVEMSDGRFLDQVGRLTVIGFEVSRTTGTALFRAEVPNPTSVENPTGSLIDGQFVKVRLRGASRPDVIAVPQRSVQSGEQGHFVWIIDPAGKAEMRPVTIGEWSPPDWIIDQGLTAGDRVVVEGTMRLQPGAVVQIVTDAPPNTPPANLPATPTPAPANTRPATAPVP